MKYSDIIIIGAGNHHNTLGVVRALGKRGFDFLLLTYGNPHKHYVTSSKYVVNHTEFKTDEEIIEYLHSSSYTNKAIIISCADSITELLSIHYDELKDRYFIPVAKGNGLMCKYQDKNVMIDMMSMQGVKSPMKWMIPNDIENCSYPCITKNFRSSKGGKDGVVIINNRKELDSFCKSFKDKFFLQEYINKKEEVQFIGCSIDEGKDVIIPGMTKIIRSQNNTNTGFLEFGAIDSFWRESVEKCKQYLSECKYSGLFSIEFIRDYNDNIYYLETNFRNDGNAYCVTVSGVNLPVIWVKHCMGKPVEDEIKPVKRILVMPEFQDFKLVLQRKLSIFKWILDVGKTDCFLEWDADDKKPFFKFLLNKIF